MSSPDLQHQQTFTVPALSKALSEVDALFYTFVDSAGLSAEIYELPAGGHDPQQPHELDEIYIVIQGEAQLRINDHLQHIGPGSVIFVKARVPHRFVNIQTPLQVLVYFSKAKPEIEHTPDFLYHQILHPSTVEHAQTAIDVDTLTISIHHDDDHFHNHHGVAGECIDFILSGSARTEADGRPTTVETGQVIWWRQQTPTTYEKPDKNFHFIRMTPK